MADANVNDVGSLVSADAVSEGGSGDGARASAGEAGPPVRPTVSNAILRRRSSSAAGPRQSDQLSGVALLPGKIVEVHYVGVSWKTGPAVRRIMGPRQHLQVRSRQGRGHRRLGPGYDRHEGWGRRRITIPTMLAYGKRAAGRAIGPDETLVFVVDLISVG